MKNSNPRLRDALIALLVFMILIGPFLIVGLMNRKQAVEFGLWFRDIIRSIIRRDFKIRSWEKSE